MPTVTTEHGEFTADTLKAATKQAEAAERVAAKRAARVEEFRKIARVRAEATAWRIAERILRGDSFPCGWRFITPDDTPHTSCKTTIVQHRGAYSMRHEAIRFETEHGKSTWETVGMTYVGSVENGAGFTLAIVLKDDTTEAVELYAVGVHEGVFCPELMSGVSPELFKRYGETAGEHLTRLEERKAKQN